MTLQSNLNLNKMNDSFEYYEQMAREQPRSKYNRGPSPTKQGYGSQERRVIGSDEEELRPINQKAPKATAPQRAVISIDENEDTIHNDRDFYQRVINKGKNLASHMEEALGDDAWRQIHGPHVVPKSYKQPFSNNIQDEMPGGNSHSDNVYDMEIEANLNRKRAKKEGKNEPVPETRPQIVVGSGDIADMKFVRVQVKTLKVFDQTLLKELVEENQMSLVLSVPLINMYTKAVDKQIVKVSNFEFSQLGTQGAFEFNYSTTFKFFVSDETLNKWSNSDFSVFIENKFTSGTVSMAKLQLARGFKLQTQVQLFREISEKELKNKTAAAETKVDPKKKNQKKEEAPRVDKFTKAEAQLQLAGTLDIEINLQQGNSEEEANKNYHIKLQQQTELQEHEQKVAQLERRQQAVCQMEKDPIFAQLYLNIGQIGQGGLTIDREGKDIPQLAQDAPEQDNVKKANRCLFVRYKSFPPNTQHCERLETSVQLHENTPNFRHRAQFPVMMSTTNIEVLEKFTFRLEVWDQIKSGQDQLVGIVKIPLASFCHTLKTSHEDTFSLNFLAHQHNQYPIMIINEDLPIYSFQHDKNVGMVKVTMGLGTPVQVNRWIENEKELEQTQMRQALEAERSNLQRQLMRDMARTQAGGTMEGHEQKMRTLIDEADLKRKKEEEEAVNSNPLLGLLGGPKTSNLNSPGKRLNQMDKFANALRMSLASAGNQDFDLRQKTYLNSLRKLFEDIRVLQLQHDVCFDKIFGQEVSNHAGTVSKDDFIYSLLRTDGITLTKTEISHICELMLNIDGKDDRGNISIAALQKSLEEYLKQYEVIKNRIIDILEKILMSIQKKLDSDEEINDLCQAITDRCTDSKILRQDLRLVLEDQHGIVISEGIYDQLCAYFDLDRSGQIYISSMLDYIQDPTIAHFNFFKVSPHVIASKVTDYVRDQVQNKKETLVQLELAFLEDIFYKKCDDEEQEITNSKLAKKRTMKKGDAPPANLLLNEKINAKMFQAKLKRQGIELSLWEVFTLFEYLNTVIAKQNFYEPLRYHQCLWEHFSQLVTGKTDYRQLIENKLNPKKRSKAAGGKRDWKDDDALELAESLNDTIEDSSSVEDSDSSDANCGPAQDLSRKRKKDEKKPYNQVKHIFDINLTSLHQIPILQKFINNNTDFELASQQLPQTSSYIQTVAMKYSFPLDEDEIYESDYIKRNTRATEDHTIYDYDVSMNTVHTYKLSKRDTIQNHLTKGSLFNISLVVFQDQKEFVIGNAQMPIEDILDLVEDYEKQKRGYLKTSDTSEMKRVIFVYGTSYSQRENCIIGKVGITMSYQAARQIITAKEASMLKNSPLDSCFMHRETYINRKIPLNAVMSFYIDRVTNLKESLENIEHFAKINQDLLQDNSILPKSQKVDRRRVLTQILKNGLNLEVISSIFQEEMVLKERFAASEQRTRKLFNSLCPVFDEGYQLPIQMDTKIFDYIKTKRAVFEVRHYITTDENDTDPQYITLGHVKVPLLHLITKNNGIDGEFNILDEYKQKMGCLRLRIALNHHNNARPLFQGSNKIPSTQRPGTLIDRSLKDTRGTSTSLSLQRQIISQGKFLLCINFVELVIRERSDLLNLQPDSSSSLYLKFKILNQEFRSKFIPLQKDGNMQLVCKSKVNMMTFDVNRTVFVDIDMDNTFEVEDAFGRPLEIQLWHKVTSDQKYSQPSHEDLVGSFFVELNELPKIQNKKIKGHRHEHFLCHESYFTMYDFKNEKVTQERLGMKLYLINNSHPQFKDELDRVFNTIVNIGEMDKIQEAIARELDPHHRGYCNLDSLVALVQDQITDKRTSLTLCTLIGENLEYKDDRSVFYSPLLCLPPPYFKWTEEIDSQQAVVQFFWELRKLDSHQQGFVPVSLMKTVLVDQLRVKQKIVEDFISEVQSNRLDTNRTANSLQNLQFDYMILIRKLLMSTPVKALPEPSVERAASMVLNIKIESAIRLQNPESRFEPPNTFVRVRCPYDGVRESIQTSIVQQSCYPYWPNPITHELQIPMTQANLQKISHTPVEFEVMHMSTLENIAYPIGVAFIEINSFFDGSKSQLSGYFDIVDRNGLRNSMSGSQSNNGQLKLTIKNGDAAQDLTLPKVTLSRPVSQSDEVANEHPISNMQWSQTFGTKNDALQTSVRPKQSAYLDNKISFIESEINEQDDDQLIIQHAKNMSDLDGVLLKLKLSLNGGETSHTDSPFNHTVKHEEQQKQLADQLQVVQKRAKDVFNPFESKIREHSEEEDFYDEDLEGDQEFARGDSQ